jgi:hypothetical protein
MLNQPTLEKLQTMKLHGMADAFRTQLETTNTSDLSFEERFALLVDQQWLWKENRALSRRLRAAKLKERGVVEDIDYQHPRGLDRKLMRTLTNSDWVRQHQMCCSLARLGLGKHGLAVRWRRRLVAMASPSCTSEPTSYSASWPWRTWTEASAVCWPGWLALTSWYWMTSPWRR